MNKVRLAISMAAVLTTMCGCAHVKPNDLAAQAPVKTYSSAKDARSVSICITSGWENAVTQVGGDAPTTTSRETESGFRIISYVGGRLRYMAEVSALPTGSQTKVYDGPMTIVVGGNIYVAKAASCQ